MYTPWRKTLLCMYCQKRSDFCPPMKSESPHPLITVLTFISIFRAVGCNEEKKGHFKPLNKGRCRGIEGNVKSDLICHRSWATQTEPQVPHLWNKDPTRLLPKSYEMGYLKGTVNSSGCNCHHHCGPHQRGYMYSQTSFFSL